MVRVFVLDGLDPAGWLSRQLCPICNVSVCSKPHLLGFSKELELHGALSLEKGSGLWAVGQSADVGSASHTCQLRGKETRPGSWPPNHGTACERYLPGIPGFSHSLRLTAELNQSEAQTDEFNNKQVRLGSVYCCQKFLRSHFLDIF